MRRLVLFDIDGTLVSGRAAKPAFEAAMVETYGTVGDLASVSFAGKTDPQIARELLSTVGFGDETIDAGLAELWKRYLGHLEERLVELPMRVLPGVNELMEALMELDDVALGLLTGNIADGARLKLGSVGLWGHFAVGGFGSDREERDELPDVALGRASAHWAVSFEAAQAVIVGDTPRDVSCGKGSGIRTLAVATGSYGAAELADAGADHVVEDLSVTRDVVTLLTTEHS